jgi:hypothetical protein
MKAPVKARRAMCFAYVQFGDRPVAIELGCEMSAEL